MTSNETYIPQDSDIAIYRGIFEKHHNEITGLYREAIGSGLGLVKLVFEHNNEVFRKILSVAQGISELGEGSIDRISEYSKILIDLDNKHRIMSENHKKMQIKIAITEHKLNELKLQFREEEGKYKQIIDLKENIDAKLYRSQRIKSLIQSLEIAEAINRLKKELVSNKRDITRSEAQLVLADHIRNTFRYKQYGEIHDIKRSLGSVRIIAEHFAPG
ncbi:hypothetical protein G3480_25265 [Thiorhodococcus mannitoliphagus]|uniref:Uncharacterized protein n=1 Tax=Thiorhodococcus mannitoliphagus TaxID=329406 RepID=A0A6P1E0W4_9GAMM|nr:hypothetical protein [Thiorhodococcus mannitoliphagus]NEX23549.1 hypothetical protein [Thiorhodococcus mannitoliphagus]